MSMVIGVLQIKLNIDGALSIHDKRAVVNSLTAKLQREYQVSVAEVDQIENQDVAVLGISMVSTDVQACQSTLDHLVNKIKTKRNCVLDDYSIEIITGSKSPL